MATRYGLAIGVVVTLAATPAALGQADDFYALSVERIMTGPPTASQAAAASQPVPPEQAIATWYDALCTAAPAERSRLVHQVLWLPPGAEAPLEGLLARADLPDDLRPLVERARDYAHMAEQNRPFFARLDATQRWMLKQTLEVYEQTGQHDAKWDEAVRHACRANAYASGEAFESTELLMLFSALHALNAKGAGCRDPMVQVLEISGRGRFYLARYESLGWDWPRVAKAMQGSAYGPYLKALACARAAIWVLKEKKIEDRTAQATKWVDQGFALLPTVLADPDLPRRLARRLVVDLVVLRLRLVGMADVDEVLTPALGVVTTALPGALSLPHEIRGGVYAAVAEIQRKSPELSTQEQRKQSQESARLAIAAYEQAASMSPDSSSAACGVLRVLPYLPHERALMEDWYARALKADPWSREAREGKMECLRDAPYGGCKALTAFARECAATHAFPRGVPFLLSAAYLMHPGHMEPPKRWAEYAKPDVWAGVQDAYADYCATRRDNWWARSMYARLACEAGRWHLAEQIFQDLETTALLLWHPWVNKECFDEQRAMARKMAQAAPTSQPTTAASQPDEDQEHDHHP